MIDILLVDDSPVDRELFATLLGGVQDFEVRCCENGLAALDAMEAQLPDIVVTDMRMPGMDGLDLVQHIRQRFTRTPVILITGQGSEDLATKALRAGAAGYVPKSHGQELLCSTIRHVLQLNQTSQIEARIREYTALIQYELKLANDESLIPGTLQLIRQRIAEIADVDHVTLLQIEVAIEHAIMNAIYHGNLEFAQWNEFDKQRRIQHAKTQCKSRPYGDRRVSVGMRVSKSEARFVVKDEGQGFDVKEVSALGLTQSLRGEFGQGLFLMWAFMDKVVFDKAGNGVTLLKHFRTPESSSASDASETAKELPPTQQTPLAMLCHKKSGQQYPLFKERVTIGRDPSCDVEIPSSSVSHHHCLLILHEGWWFVRDLKSKNGLRVNGHKHESHLLPPASVLTVGSVDLEVQYQPHKLGGVGITPPDSPF